MEIGGTGFASIAFGYPNALWGEPQSPMLDGNQTKGERKNVRIYTWYNDWRGNGCICDVFTDLRKT